MKTLRDRLIWAMTRGTQPITNVELVKACAAYGTKISSAAVAKWFTSTPPPAYLKPAYVFAVAKACGVDPEWLATGKGSAVRSGVKQELTAKILAMVKAYDSLPPEVQISVQTLIHTLAMAQSHRYAQWSKKTDEFNKKRDLVHSRVDD